MNVLITGGTGTISAGIAEESAKQGFTTYAITRGNHSSRNVEGVNYIKADVRDKNSMEEALKDLKIDIVVECLVYDTKQLKLSLDIFAKKCKQYIFISTAGVYDRKDRKVKESAEQTQLEWKYSRDKIECETELKKYYKQNITDGYYTIVRPFVTYGNYRVPFPVVSRNNQWTIFERINQGCPIVACNNIKFPIIHIKDFSYAVVKLFNNEKAINEDFHIAESNKEIYWDDVIKESAKILNKDVNIIHIPVELFKKVFFSIYEELKWNKITEMYVDDSKLKSVINDFEQKVDIKEGMKDTIETQKRETENGENTLDYNWWINCDLILLYAYKKNKINDNVEKEIVKKYIDNMDKETKNKIYKFYFKEKFIQMKRFIKRIINEVRK